MPDPHKDIIDETIAAVNVAIVADLTRLANRGFDPVRVGFCAVASSIAFLAAHGAIPLEGTVDVVDAVMALLKKHRNLPPNEPDPGDQVLF